MQYPQLTEGLQPHLQFFYHWEQTTPQQVFLRQPYGASWRELTYAEAGQTARRLATALQEMGLQQGDQVGILSKNCYHWILADLAIMMAGLVSVPYYASLPKDSLAEVLELSQLRVLFVGKLDEWGDKIEAIPSDVAVIRFPHYAGNAEISIGQDWDTLIAQHAPLAGQPLPRLDDLWTILFTSGTTGTPKGVMHTYRNPATVFRIEELTNYTGALTIGPGRWFSFLPLNHVAERIGVMTNALCNGGSISFAESITTFAANIQSVQPNFLFAVPRIWQKFQQGVFGVLPERLLMVLFTIPLIGTFVKRLLRKKMGLGALQVAGTGAAITPAHVKDWYRQLGIHLIEAYGMTEVCGSICYGPQADAPTDSVGKAVPFCEVKIDPTTQEILMRAPYQMLGYYQAPEKTAEVIRNGWVHSGDRGTLDENGYLRVIGRMKDAFKTAKGQFIVPNPLEEALSKNEWVEQVCVVGLGCPQPIALVNLIPEAVQNKREEIEQQLQATLAQINASLASYHRLSTVVVDSEIWSETNRLLTPTLKVRRVALDERYRASYLLWHEAPAAIVWKQ